MSLIDRARDKIPDNLSSKSRWKLPEPQILIEGSNTIFRNFNEVVSMMDRDDNHVYQYILNEFVPLVLEMVQERGSRVEFLRRESRKRLSIMLIHISYAANALHQIQILSKKKGLHLLKCQACGATRPVKL